MRHERSVCSYLVLLSIGGLFIFNSASGLKYLACYKENSGNDRLLKGALKSFSGSLTPQICHSYCKAKGMRFFGLQYGNECFCSVERPSIKFIADANECDLKCAGNPRETCGGNLRLSVYDSELDLSRDKYLGCYQERSPTARLFNGAVENYPGTLTNQKCADFCRSKGFSYSGTQYKRECFCSNERPHFKSLADEEECSDKCEGDEGENCGGNYRLSVYDLFNESTNHVLSNYMGCYQPSQYQSQLIPNRKDYFEHLLTPELCSGFCYRKGYRFAGMESESYCYCANAIDNVNKVNDKFCDKPCPGDSNFKCGGDKRLSVYHTEISDQSEEGRLLGCLEDNGSLRILSGMKITFVQTNTPKLCLNVCLQSGFKYAGVQFGNECYCGNRLPPATPEKPESECSMTCPGDRFQMCGGDWRMLVYSTGGTANSFKPVVQVLNARPPVETATTTKPTTTTTNTKKPTTTTQKMGWLLPNQQQTTTFIPRTTKPNIKPLVTSRPNSNPNYPDYGEAIVTSFEQEKVPPDNFKPSSSNCNRSITEVRGKKVCKGEVIFYDDFSSGSQINSYKWAHEVIMPWTPDYEFVVYRKNYRNCFIKNGKLYIKPTLFDDNFVKRGSLELESCTGLLHSEECRRQGATYNIIPPIESSRLTTKESFSFKYGIIQVRAKMPRGDWIVPEIWLEPKQREYGTGAYASGRIRIAMARGNQNLEYNGIEIGNRQLEVGVLMGVDENIRARTIIRDKADGWWRSFHNYTLIWTPDNMRFLIDGQFEESLLRQGTPLYQVAGFDEDVGRLWKKGSLIAPFDKEFFVSLSLSVGGMRDFPDDCSSAGHEKPWKNFAVKAMASFWEDRKYWYNSWTDDSELQIEHVMVTAL